MQLQQIAGYNGTPEFYLLDAREEKFSLRLGQFQLEQANQTGLRQRFDYQHTRHDGITREMPSEKRFINRNFFLGYDRIFFRVDIRYLIDE